MISEFFNAVFNMGFPVWLISFVLVWSACAMNYLGQSAGLGEVEKELAKRSRSKSRRKKAQSGDETEDEADSRRLNPVHDKWLAFGGGFYGVVALYTYIKVELSDLAGFIERYNGLFGLVSSISVDLLVDIFIDAIMNFVVAISWPVYWLGEAAGQYMWIWFVVAYGAYWLGARMALKYYQQRHGDDPGQN